MGGEEKREFTTKSGNQKLIHSLESMNYLKIDPTNFIKFEFSGENKSISIVQQYNKYHESTGFETAYDDIYNCLCMGCYCRCGNLLVVCSSVWVPCRETHGICTNIQSIRL